MRKWSVPPAPASFLDASDSTFQGRAAERARFRAVAAAAEQGLRQAVFLSGDAGIGKSRLAGEMVGPLAAECAVMVGHCLPDYPVAYEPFRGPLRVMLGALDFVVSADRREEVRGLLAALMPSSADEILAEEGERAANVRAHFDAVVEVLRGMSRDQLVVLVLEDVHWATPSTAALLSYLVRRMPGSRLLVVATFRSSLPDRSVQLAGAVAELLRLRGVHRIELMGLDAAEVEAVLQA